MRSFLQLFPVAVALKAFLLLGSLGHKLPSSLVPGVQTAPSVQPTVSQGCLDTVRVTLNANCQFVLTPNLVLEGFSGCLLSPSDYEIIVDDENPLNQNIVDGCGYFRFLVSVKNPATCPTFSHCWGIIAAEDKNAPVVKAPIKTTLFVYCDDINLIYRNPKSIKITGAATFTDNCQQRTDTLRKFEDAIYYNNQCDSVVIRRSFFATDQKGNTGSDFQFIYLVRAPLDSVKLVDSVAINTCTEIKNRKTDGLGNVHPDVSGYPYVINHLGLKDQITVDSSCGLNATYIDTRFEVCLTTYKLLRRWIIKDWCKKTSIELTQVIKVGDVDAPKIKIPYPNDLLLVSTGPFDCTAGLEVLPPIVTDLCSTFEWSADIWTDPSTYNYTGQKPPISSNGQVLIGSVNSKLTKRYINNLPIGFHRLVYEVRDACHNHIKDTITIQVQDKISPRAICDDRINVSLNEFGQGSITAAEVDEGSQDNCKLARIAVRRMVPAFCEASFITKKYDTNGNGKLDAAPFDDPRDTLPDWKWIVDGKYVVDGIDNNGDGDIKDQGEFFATKEGKIMTPQQDAIDFFCCDLKEFVKVELRVTDISGNTDYCWSTIWVDDKLPPHCKAPPSVDFLCDRLPKGANPKDSSTYAKYFGIPMVTDNCGNAEWFELAPEIKLNNCGVGTIKRFFRAKDEAGNESDICTQIITIKPSHNYLIKFPKDYTEYCKEPTPDTIGVFELGCDILAVNVQNKRYGGDGVECYKVFRTYSVINWCEYEDGDEIVTVSRDVDCDGIPGDEDVWVIVRQDTTFYDADNHERNKFPKANTRGLSCDGIANPEGYWKSSLQDPSIRSTGHWSYTQVIKVVDNIPPLVFTESNLEFCSNKNNCEADVVLSVGIEEACNPDFVDVETDLKLEVIESSSNSQTNWRRFGRYPKYLFQGVVPKGEYELEIKVQDACGNVARAFVKFKVVDCKPPTVTCIYGLSAELSELPPNTDVDGDGDVDRASTIIWAKELVASPSIDSCSGPVRYSINRKGEKANINKDYLILTCDDLGLTEVELHAWDAAINPKLSPPGPNHDFCQTYIKVQDNKFNLCKDPGDTLIIEGNARTEQGLALSGVVVNSSGAKRLEANSNQTGNYRMQGLAQGYDYTLTADKVDDPRNGVTTYDLFLISQHILGKKRLSSPYQLLAADVNQSGSISTIDIIKIRKVILNLDQTFDGGKTWLFLDAKYRFRNPENPWADGVPKYIQFNDLNQSVADAGFLGVKLGDVNGTYAVSELVEHAEILQQKIAPLKNELKNNSFKLLSIQPNPFRDQVQINWSSAAYGEGSLQLIDAFGRVIRQDQVHMVVGTNSYTYLRSNLPSAGTYSVIIHFKDQRIISRLVLVD